MKIPAYAPGCFGSAIAFSKTDLVCTNCPFAGECEVGHEQTASLLREKFGLAPVKKVAPAPKPVPVLDPAALKLPKKVQDLLHKLDTGNYDVVGKLQRGENPFGATLPFMAVACHLLLRMGRPIDRNLISAALAQKFGWQKSTADEHARIAVYALLHVGAVQSMDGQLTIKEKAIA